LDDGKSCTAGCVRGATRVDKLMKPEAIALCEKMLDFAALRQKVIANNVANVNTPGFRRSDVEFADELDRVLRDKGIAGLKGLRLKVTQPNETAFRNDGNNVSMEKEMATLTVNTMMYKVYAQMLQRKFRQIDAILKDA
jgi:flagellar basal-body rod protein FlgB